MGQQLPYPSGVAFVIRFLPSEARVTAAPGTTLLEAAQSAGLPIARACEQSGTCGRCGLQIVEGASALEPESPREVGIKERNRIDANLRLACLVRPTSDVAVTATYW